MTGTSSRMDVTSIKVGKSCQDLYRAVNREGPTTDFMLTLPSAMFPLPNGSARKS